MGPSTDFSVLTEQLREQLNVDVCSLYLKTDQEKLKLFASSGLNQSITGVELTFSQGLTGKVARECKPLSVKNPQTHPDYHHIKHSGEENYHSYLGIPLHEHHDLYGVLVVQTTNAKMFKMSEITALYDAGKLVIQAILAQAQEVA